MKKYVKIPSCARNFPSLLITIHLNSNFQTHFSFFSHKFLFLWTRRKWYCHQRKEELKCNKIAFYASLIVIKCRKNIKFKETLFWFTFYGRKEEICWWNFLVDTSFYWRCTCLDFQGFDALWNSTVSWKFEKSQGQHPISVTLHIFHLNSPIRH